MVTMTKTINIEHDVSAGDSLENRTCSPIGGTFFEKAAGQPSDKMLAEQSQVKLRNFQRVKVTLCRGIPEVKDATRDGRLSTYRAELISRLPPERQLAELQSWLSGSKSKRQPWTLRADADRLASLINQLSRRWSDKDRRVISAVLREWAEHIVGADQIAEVTR